MKERNIDDDILHLSTAVVGCYFSALLVFSLMATSPVHIFLSTLVLMLLLASHMGKIDCRVQRECNKHTQSVEPIKATPPPVGYLAMWVEVEQPT